MRYANVLYATVIVVLLTACAESHGRDGEGGAALDGAVRDAGPEHDAGPERDAGPPIVTGPPVHCGPNLCRAGEICCNEECGVCAFASECVDRGCLGGP